MSLEQPSQNHTPRSGSPRRPLCARRRGELSINYGGCFDDDNTVAAQPPVTLMAASWSSMGTI